jgi:hypothetical protein
VAVGVVHLFEAVEVDHHHSGAVVVPVRLGEGVLEAVVEERPVWEPGEAVVERAELGLLRGGRLLCRLPERAGEADDHRREQQGQHGRRVGVDEKGRRRDECREQADSCEAGGCPRRRPGEVSGKLRDDRRCRISCAAAAHVVPPVRR